MNAFVKEWLERQLSQHRFISKSVHLFYQKFLKPKSATEDLRRREFILNIILASSLALLFFLDLTVLYQSLAYPDYHGISFPVFTGIVLLYLGIYILSRRGWFIAAAYIFIGIYFLTTTYSAFRWGVDLPSVLLSYVVIIVIASILVSTRFGFVVTLFSALALSGVGWLHISLRVVPETYWKSQPNKTNDIAEYVITFFVIMTVSWLSNREIERSLRRARQSEQALKQQRDLLEIKVEERGRRLHDMQAKRMEELHRLAESGRLAAGFFHDLMNPLTAIALAIQQLKISQVQGIGGVQQSLDQALTASRRMESFIAAIRQQTKKEESKTWFFLNDEILQALKLLEHRAKSAGVKLIFHTEEPLRTFGRPWQFYQVINNVVSNAIDSYAHMSPEVPNREVTVSLDARHANVRITIRDHGEGIDLEKQNKIFDPFFTTKSDRGGMGLGLSIVKAIIENEFGGTINIESDGTHGTIVILEFPLTLSMEAHEKDT